MPAYDAFISYSHAKDKPVAAALQSAVQTLGKPWFRLRALRVFRDDTSLSATPHLWPTIEAALSQSRYLILFASPEAASSKWVDDEIDYWIRHRSVDTLLLAVTDGDLVWDPALNDFSRPIGVPLPPALSGKFPDEPKWVDLRIYRNGADRRDARFIELAADFSATIQGIPKEDLLSQELRQKRRALTLASSAAVALAVLAGAAGWEAYEAARQREIAIANEARARNALDRAERNLSIANGAVRDLIFKLSTRFRDRQGVPIAFIRETLDLANATILKLLDAGEDSPTLIVEDASTFLLTALNQSAVGDQESAKTLLTSAIRTFESVAQTEPGLSAQLAIFTSLAYRERGNAEIALNQLPEAIASFRMALSAAAHVGGTTAEESNTALALTSTEHLLLGDALLTAGSTDEAFAEHRKALAAAQDLAKVAPGSRQTQEALALGYERVAIALMGRRDLQHARQMFESAASIIDQRVQAEPDSTAEKRSLSVIKNKLGDILVESEEFGEARKSYDESLVLMEQLARSDADRADWQRDLSINYLKVGDVMAKLGDDRAALTRYQSALATTADLAKKHPEEYHWQWDLAVRHSRIGAVQLRLGDPRAALASVRTAAAIGESLAKQDISRPDLMRDLSVFYEQSGDASEKLGNADDALASYQRCVEIRRALVDKEPSRLQWRIDLAVAYEHTADHHIAGKDLRAAVAPLQAAADLRTQLSAERPSEPELLRLLVRDRTSLVTSYLSIGDAAGGITQMKLAVDAQRRIVDLEPSNVDELRELAVLHNRGGEMMWRAGEREQAVEVFQQALAVRKRLVEIDDKTVQWQIDLAISHFRLAHRGVAPAEHMKDAVAVTTRLDQEGRLNDNQRKLPMMMGMVLRCVEEHATDPASCFPD
jgi:tetratricopeptide (TPR) repeat protein